MFPQRNRSKGVREIKFLASPEIIMYRIPVIQTLEMKHLLHSIFSIIIHLRKLQPNSLQILFIAQEVNNVTNY